MAYISKAELAEGQKLPWIGVCPVFPGADWEPRENSKHRVRLQKASPDTEVVGAAVEMEVQTMA